MSFRPRNRVSGAAIGGAQRLPFAASRHACMQACTSRNASCQRRTCTAAESRGRTIGNGVTSGNKMERNKKGVPFPDGMYRGLNFILPWKTCRVLSYLLRKKEKKTENEGLQAFRPPRSRPDVSVTKSIGSILSDLHLRARQCVCMCVVTGARDGERSGIGVGGGGGGGKEKFSYRLADKRRKTRRMEGVGARHLSGKGKRHDGISEIALDIFACISLSLCSTIYPLS